MTYEEFWKRIIITEDEKKKSEHYLQYRGINEHDHVRQHLESLSGRIISYAEIATAFRYDKRIRRVLYRYIGLLEEFMRAFIANKYDDKLNKLKLIPQAENYFKEENDLFCSLSRLLFSQLVEQVKRLPKKDKQSMFPYYHEKITKLSGALAAVNTLRNAVSHNRYLLDNRILDRCSVGDKNNSLWSNIVNLHNCLPAPYKEHFINDINNCSIKGDVDDSFYQTEWILIESLTIRL